MFTGDFLLSFKFRFFKKLWNFFSIKKYHKTKNNSLISYNLEVTKPNKLIFKGEVFIDHNCFFQSNGGIEIGDNCSIARDVKVFTHKYSYTIKEQFNNLRRKHNYEMVSIGNNTTIGYNVIINPGTKIGDNSVIGAGSVVNIDIPKNTIVSGNPIKILNILN